MESPDTAIGVREQDRDDYRTRPYDRYADRVSRGMGIAAVTDGKNAFMIEITTVEAPVTRTFRGDGSRSSTLAPDEGRYYDGQNMPGVCCLLET